MPDFTPKTPAIDPSALANAMQRKVQIEQQMKAQEEQKQSNRFNQIVQAVQAGQTIAANMMNLADKRQDMKRKSFEDEGKKKAVDLLNNPLNESQFTDPDMLTVAKQDRMKQFESAIAQGNFDEYSRAVLRNKFEQTSAGDTSIEALELPDGRVVQVIVNKNSKEVFDLAGNKLDKEVLEQSKKGFAPQITEDLEGRKSLVSRGGKVKGVFGESKSPEDGKETRIQFTPEERKVVLDSRRSFAEDDYVKKSLPLLKTLEKTRQLVEENPQGNIGPIQTDAARLIAGEVARLTDDDIGRNIPTQNWAVSLTISSNVVFKESAYFF